jgi:glycosyltransferase involved in cell wall biosynthesis
MKRAILAFPCADACSITRPKGGIGAATYAYANALSTLGWQVDIIGSKRAIVDKFKCLRVDRVADIVPTLIALAPSYDLVVTIGLHSRLTVETAKQLVAESKALIYECEDEPTMALKQYNAISQAPNVRFISDRLIDRMPKARPAVSVPAYSNVRTDFVLLPQNNRFIYAGRIASDKNILGLLESPFDVDYCGDASGFPHYVEAIQSKCSDAFRGRYVPAELYPTAVALYAAFISFSYERGISYQLVEALRCGMPLVLAKSNPAWPSLMLTTEEDWTLHICEGRHKACTMGVVVDTDNIQDGDVDKIADYCATFDRHQIARIADENWGSDVLRNVFTTLIEELGAAHV